jgi:PadR family transcriptional regulator, regulatory protein PadR
MRRKPGALVPLEQAICASAAGLRRRGVKEFHGYELAKQMADDADRRLLTAYGSLYRALGRLEGMGLLQSRWEDPEIPARENRPGRRLYTLTAAGELAAREASTGRGVKLPRRTRRRIAPA